MAFVVGNIVKSKDNSFYYKIIHVRENEVTATKLGSNRREAYHIILERVEISSIEEYLASQVLES